MVTLTRPTWNIKGSASIVFFYFGDGYLTTLAQETTKLTKALEGYDYSVLLKHDVTVGPFEISAAAANAANVTMTPTQSNLVQAIKDTAAKGYMIDLWIFSHGRDGEFRVSSGNNGSAGKFTAAEITRELGKEGTGFNSLPIRTVYQMNCYGRSLNASWRGIGAKASMGARFVNFYPNQFARFADRWSEGASFAEARDDADNDATRTVVQTYLAMVRAPSCNREWGSCPFGKTILGDDPCAKDYLTTMWIGNSEWQAGLSGKENINYASFKAISGDKTLTRRSEPGWTK